jgi:hypothetical protein
VPWAVSLASSPEFCHCSILLRQFKMNEKKTALIVSGMHRSGTSSIAGVVGMLGASLPQNLLPPNFDNPLGFFESDKVMRLNDKILSESGSSWPDWRAVDNDWQTNPHFNSYLSEASLILTEEFGASNFIVLKDPRFAKLLSFWNCVLEKLAFRPCHIIPTRDPAEVAASLFKRDALSRNLSKMLWLRHVLDAEMYSRGLSRVFVCWPNFLQDWEREAESIAKILSFSWPRLTDHVRSKVGEFLSPELRHHHKASGYCTDDVADNEYIKRARIALNSFSKDPNSTSGMKIFDSIRKDYLKTERIYGPLFADMDAANGRQKNELDQTKAQVAELAKRAGELESLLNATVLERDAARHYSGDINALVVGKDNTIGALSGELDQTKTQVAELAKRVGELEPLLSATVLERDAARRYGDDVNALIVEKDNTIGALSGELDQTKTQVAELAKRVGELEPLLNATVLERDAARRYGDDVNALIVGKDNTIGALSGELDQTKTQVAELAKRVGELEPLLNATVLERDAVHHLKSALENELSDLQSKLSISLERSLLAESELEKLRNLSSARKIADILGGWAKAIAKNSTREHGDSRGETNHRN